MAIPDPENKVRIPEIPSCSISISEEATNYANKKLMDKASGILRVTVKSGGCSGYEYNFSEDNKSNLGNHPCIKDYIILSDSGNVSAVIDGASLAFMDEKSKIILLRTDSGMGLSVSNPLENSRCGCGRSVSIKKNNGFLY